MQNLQNPPTLKDKIRLYRPYILLVVALVMLFAHIYVMIFGDKSLTVLLELRKQEESLQKSIAFHKKQNAKMQKEIFELSGE